MKIMYGVTHESISGDHIWDGWYNTLEEAYEYAVNHYLLQCRRWKKALYITCSTTEDRIYLVPQQEA